MTGKKTKTLLAALDVAVLDLRAVAEEAGISEGSLYSYRCGARRPSEQTVEALTKVLTRHGRRLAKALDRLRETSE